MTKEVLSKAINLNSNIHRLRELLKYLNKDNYGNCLYEKIGELLYTLYEHGGDSKIRDNIRKVLEELIDKAETEFNSL